MHLRGCGYALENVRNFTAAGIQFHPFFLVFFAWVYFQVDPIQRTYTQQTTRLNANQPRPLAQRRRGLAQVKPRILSVAWAA